MLQQALDVRLRRARHVPSSPCQGAVQAPQEFLNDGSTLGILQKI